MTLIRIKRNHLPRIRKNISNPLLFLSYEDVVELLLKHGARVDVEARMCWPGVHQQNCEERSKHRENNDGRTGGNNGSGAGGGGRGGGRAGAPPGRPMTDSERVYGRSFDKLQCAIYYAIDGDQVSHQ